MVQDLDLKCFPDPLHPWPLMSKSMWQNNSLNDFSVYIELIFCNYQPRGRREVDIANSSKMLFNIYREIIRIQ